MEKNKINELINIYNDNKKSKQRKSSKIKIRSIDKNNINKNSFLEIVKNVKKEKKMDKHREILKNLKILKNEIVNTNNNKIDNKIKKIKNKINVFENLNSNYNNEQYGMQNNDNQSFFYQIQSKLDNQNYLIQALNSKVNKLKKKNRTKKKITITNKKIDKNINDPIFLKLILESDKVPDYYKDYVVKNKYISQIELMQIVNYFVLSKSNRNVSLKNNTIDESKECINKPGEIIPIVKKKNKIRSTEVLCPIVPYVKYSKNPNRNFQKYSFAKINNFPTIDKYYFEDNTGNIRSNIQKTKTYLNNKYSIIGKPKTKVFFKNPIQDIENEEEIIKEDVEEDEDIEEVKEIIKIRQKRKEKKEKRPKSNKKIKEKLTEIKPIKETKISEKNKKKFRIILYKLWFAKNIEKILWEISDENYNKSQEYFKTDFLPTIDNFINEFNKYFYDYLNDIKNYKFKLNNKNNPDELITSIESLFKIIINYLENQKENIYSIELIKLLSNSFMNGCHIPNNYLNKFEINRIQFSFSGYISYKNENMINRMLIDGLIIVRIIIYLYLFNNKHILNQVKLNDKVSLNLKVIGIFLYYCFINKFNIVKENDFIVSEKRDIAAKKEDKFYNPDNKFFTTNRLPIYGIPDLEEIIDKNSSKFINKSSLAYNIFSQKIYNIIKNYKLLENKKVNEFKKEIIFKYNSLN